MTSDNRFSRLIHLAHTHRECGHHRFLLVNCAHQSPRWICVHPNRPPHPSRSTRPVPRARKPPMSPTPRVRSGTAPLGSYVESLHPAPVTGEAPLPAGPVAALSAVLNLPGGVAKTGEPLPPLW